MNQSLLKIVSKSNPIKKSTKKQTKRIGNPGREAPSRRWWKNKNRKFARLGNKVHHRGNYTEENNSRRSSDSNTRSHKAVEGSHGQPSKERWLIIGCSCFRCSQVSLMRGGRKERKGGQGERERKRQKENTAPDTLENQDHYIMHVVLQAAWSVGFFTFVPPVSSQCMQRRTRSGTGELRQRVLKVGHLHRHCLQRTMKKFFLQQHTGEHVSEWVH